MNLFKRITLRKKLVVLITTTGLGFLISIPILAKTNPHPSIFNEFPYNNSSHHRPKRPKYKIKHQPNSRSKKRPATFGNYHKPTHKPIKKDPSVQRVIEFRAPGYPK